MAMQSIEWFTNVETCPFSVVTLNYEMANNEKAIATKKNTVKIATEQKQWENIHTYIYLYCVCILK